MLTVVSWNLLANAYVRPAYYPFTPPAVLAAAARDAALVERLVAEANADVLCLQEVEPALFDAAAARLGAFAGHFLQKRGKPDGCAVFARRSLGPPRFEELVYGDGTGHVALAAITGGIGVATTHLKWEAPDVPPERRLGRNQLAELLDTWLGRDETWVVCGDLNADASSPVLAGAFSRGLRDAYASLPDAYTCNSNGRRKRIDFILHTADLEATPSAIPPIDDQTPLPSPDQPSDHLAIRAALTARR